MSRILVLAAIAAALSGAIVSEVMSIAPAAPDPSSARRDTAGQARGAVGSVPDVPVASWVTTALDRPLFRENRRPAKPVGGAAQAEGATRLTGVITGPFGSRAIFSSPGNSKPIVVAEGAQVSNFLVRTIGPGLAIVEMEGGVHTLRPSVTSNESSVRQ